MTDSSMTNNLLESFDRLSITQLSKSSPSRLPPFQLKRSRSQQTPLPGNNDQSSSHTTSPPSTKQNNNNNNNNHSKSSNLSHVPCKFFKQGTCTAGANCIFSHNPDPTSESAICKYFLKGNCKFGPKCALLHTMSPYVGAADGRKVFAAKSSSSSSMAAAIGSSKSHHHHHHHHHQTSTTTTESGLAMSLGSAAAGLSALRSPPLGSPLDAGFGPHMYSPVGSYHKRNHLLSSSADARTTYLSAHRREQQDSDWLPFDEHRAPLFSSLRSDDLLGSSPFAQRALFFHHHPSSSSSSMRATPQALHSIQEGGYLDVPGRDYFDLHNNGEDNDLDDAMLPSSLNELLTPTELQLRRAREQRQQQLEVSSLASSPLRAYSFGAAIERSPSDVLRGGGLRSSGGFDLAHSPLSYTQAYSLTNRNSALFDRFAEDDYLEQQHSLLGANSSSHAIKIPGGNPVSSSTTTTTNFNGSRLRERRWLDDFPTLSSNSNPPALDTEEGPFYMEDTTTATTTTTTTTATTGSTPFDFPSLISISKSST